MFNSIRILANFLIEYIFNFEDIHFYILFLSFKYLEHKDIIKIKIKSPSFSLYNKYIFNKHFNLYDFFYIFD